MGVELVGQRCLCVRRGEAEERAGISRWSWRAGAIRAATDQPALTVCVHWDGEQCAERKWRRLGEECEVVLLEQELVWASRTTETGRLQPALRFQPLIGQACVGDVVVVEFLLDRQLGFYTDTEQLRTIKDEEDSRSPEVEDPSFQELVQTWLAQKQFLRLLQQGNCSLKGRRVKVFKQESEKQWLSGVITDQDQNNKTVTVMSDQVQDILNVDPLLVQLLLDDCSQVMEENPNHTFQTKKNNSSFVNLCTSSPEYHQSEETSQKCSLDLDKNELSNDVRVIGSIESSKSKTNHTERKRRKSEEKDETTNRRHGLKRLKADKVSDLSVNNHFENSSSGIQDSYTDPESNTQLKQNCSSKWLMNCEGHVTQRKPVSPSQVEDHHLERTPLPYSSSAGEHQTTVTLECKTKKEEEEIHKGRTTEPEDRSVGLSQEDSEAVSALLASQENERLVSIETTGVVLHKSLPESEEKEVSDPEAQRPEQINRGLNQSGIMTSGSDHSEAKKDINESSVSAPGSPVTRKDDVDIRTCSTDVMNKDHGLVVVVVLEPNQKCSKEDGPCPSPKSNQHVQEQKPSEPIDVNRLKEPILSTNSCISRTTSGPKLADNLRIVYPATTPPTQPSSPLFPKLQVQSPSHPCNQTSNPEKSDLRIVDNKEPLPSYPDPGLVRLEHDSQPTNLQPPHSPPNLEDHPVNPSASPSLTPPCLDKRLLTNSPHLSPISLHSQPPLCSIGLPHSSIPHPHLLPSLLPALSSYAEPRTGAIGLSHHPLALSGNQARLGQTSTTPPLAPLSLYPLLWPSFPSGSQSFTGQGRQAFKWTHSESSSIPGSTMRANTSVLWHPQHPVTGPAGQRLPPPMAVKPTSPDTPNVSPKTTKSTDLLDKKATTEKTLIHTQLKPEQEYVRTTAGKSKHPCCPKALESSTPRNKPPLVTYDLTNCKPNHHCEESRRMLLESSEAAPFIAKPGTERELPNARNTSTVLTSEHRERELEREQDRNRDIDTLVFRHTPRPHSAQPTPTLTPSSYYTPLPNQTQQRRAPASKELYERLSTSSSIAPVLTSISTQASIPDLQPLIFKRHLEKHEGILGKMPLTHKPSTLETAAVGQNVSGSLVSFSSSLHRATAFHPAASAVQQDCEHRRSSPPTLTPVQPMSLSEKCQKQHRPPTLLPEFKHTLVDGKRPVIEKVTSSPARDPQAGVTYSRERGIKAHSATASVIVHPARHTRPSIHHAESDSSASQTPCRPLMEPLFGLSGSKSSAHHKRDGPWPNLDSVQSFNVPLQKEDINTPLTMGSKSVYPTESSDLVTATNIKPTCSRLDLTDERETGPFVTSCYISRNFPHLKKSRAGLAVAECRAYTPDLQPQHSRLKQDCGDVLNSTNTPHVACSADALDSDKDSVSRMASGTSRSDCKIQQDFLNAGQPPVSAITTSTVRLGQNNYHKLKRAWLTRHSEQDRGVTASQMDLGCSVAVKSSSISAPVRQEPTGPVDTCFSQRDNKNNSTSVTLNRAPPSEDNANLESWTTSSTGSVKAINHVSSFDKPFLERNGKMNGNGPSEDKKSQSSLVHLKTEREMRGEKRPLESSCESGDDSSNESESCGSGQRFKRKPSFIMEDKGNLENTADEEENKDYKDNKPNGSLLNLKDQRLPNSNVVSCSVLKDWRRVKKLKQSGEAFLQDDSCAEIGTNVQKCRECRLDRSRKGHELAVSPVFCRFYYFRRLSFSKNGVVRVDGFSVCEQTDEEAVTVWTSGSEDEEDKRRQMDTEMSKSVLTYIADKFCLLVKTENTALTWVKKDTQVMWKRAVRGVREMCDACEATLFNMHWACHKCGFVVCMDCYKAREKKKAKDKELYAWVRCVKNQPHDIKNLMPTQIVPETVLLEMQKSMHFIKEKYGIPSRCSCVDHKNLNSKANGLTHNSTSYVKSRQTPDRQKSSWIITAQTERSELDSVEAQNRTLSSPEQGSRLRDLLTSTAGKLRLGSPGMAFAPVYNQSEQGAQNTRVPNILDDIIASVVENKIPTSKMLKMGLNPDLLPEEEAEHRAEGIRLQERSLADLYGEAPHDWLGKHQLLWLKDHHHQGNQSLFKETWTRAQPVLVSGLHKSLDAGLWKPEQFKHEFSNLHSDLYNCRDGSVTNAKVKDFWDGFEDVSKRAKSAKGEAVVYRLKDWPSGEEFLTLMPDRYHDVMKTLPVPGYTKPEAAGNLASYLPSFFIPPDLGPRLCCAHGVTGCPDQDFGTSNLHVEISDTLSILVFVGLSKGNGAPSKTSVCKFLESEVQDECVRKRLKDPNETPGALWHIYMSKDLQKITEFLQKLNAEEATASPELEGELDPLREGGWYLSPRLRLQLLEEHGVESHTLLQFHGDAVIIPAGALHQVMNLHSCIQVNVDFVSPEHAHNSYFLTQELRLLKDQVNYEDKLQVKNIFYHCVKEAVGTLSKRLKESTDEVKEELS